MCCTGGGVSGNGTGVRAHWSHCFLRVRWLRKQCQITLAEFLKQHDWFIDHLGASEQAVNTPLTCYLLIWVLWWMCLKAVAVDIEQHLHFVWSHESGQVMNATTISRLLSVKLWSLQTYLSSELNQHLKQGVSRCPEASPNLVSVTVGGK